MAGIHRLWNLKHFSLNILRRFEHNRTIPMNFDFDVRVAMVEKIDPRMRTRLYETPMELEDVIKTSDENLKDVKIMVPEKDSVVKLNGLPEEHQAERRARIYMVSKSTTQSGNYGTQVWRVEFDNRERWENPLIGWSSSGDPLSNITLNFNSAERAKEFCDIQGWSSFVEVPNVPTVRVKSYGENFSWNKRTRIGSK